jgi:hypothetical protein
MIHFNVSAMMENKSAFSNTATRSFATKSLLLHMIINYFSQHEELSKV